MKNFLQWLEARAPVQFGSFWKDGRITVWISGKRYVYVTDAINHPRIERMARYAPGRALNYIKKMMADGAAYQLEPPVKQEPPPPEDSDDGGAWTQGQLF